MSWIPAYVFIIFIFSLEYYDCLPFQWLGLTRTRYRQLNKYIRRKKYLVSSNLVFRLINRFFKLSFVWVWST